MSYHELLSSAGERAVTVPLGALDAPGTLIWPEHPSGVVLIAQGYGSRRSAVELSVACELRRAGLATLHLDLLPMTTPPRRSGGTTETLAARLLSATNWALAQPELNGLVPGYLAGGEGAAAALRAAGLAEQLVGAVVCLGGRPDLAGEALGVVRTPTLLIAASGDEHALEPHRRAFRRLDCVKRLVVIEGASPRLEEPGALEEAGRRAAGWLVEHLAMAPRRRERRGSQATWRRRALY